MCCVFILLYVRDYCYIGQDDSAASSVLYDRLLLKWKTFMFLPTGCPRSMAWKEFTAQKPKYPGLWMRLQMTGSYGIQRFAYL